MHFLHLFGKALRSPGTVLTALASLVAAGLVGSIYVSSVNLANPDYWDFLAVWIFALDQQGLMVTLGERVTNYTAPYVVLLDMVNRLLPASPALTVMHATGLVLHVALASILVLCAQRVGSPLSIAVLLLCAALTPTSIVNGIVWGQSDAFFTCFVLMTFLAVSRERWLVAFAFYAAALSIKLVAIFAAPALFMLLALGGAVSRLAWFPPILFVVYMGLNSPYLIAGLGVGEVASIYLDQATTYNSLSMFAPNPWYVLELHPSTAAFVQTYKTMLTAFGIGGALLTITILMGVGFRVLRAWRVTLTDVEKLWLLTLSAMLCPYLLPKMHDRYFFLADICAWLLALCDRRFLGPALLAQAGSLLAYSAFLQVGPLPTHYRVALGALCMTAALVWLIGIGLRDGPLCRSRSTSRSLKEHPGN